MGPGHFGIAFAAKPTAPKASLLALLVASEALDIFSFGFEAIGIERFAIPVSHTARLLHQCLQALGGCRETPHINAVRLNCRAEVLDLQLGGLGLGATEKFHHLGSHQTG